MNTPSEMLKLVLDTNREYAFLTSMMRHTGGYSIGEIADGHFKNRDGKVTFYSKSYDLHMKMEEHDEITGAILAGRYVSAFISRFNDNRQIHFLVHDCLAEQKSTCEELIARKSVQYMILRTIVSLRLDTRKKLENYMEGIY